MDNLIFSFLDTFGHFGVFLLMFGETVFPPLPSEVILPLAGLRASEGSLSLTGTIVAGTLGAMAGNLLWFALAKFLGLPRFRLFLRRYGRWLTLTWQDTQKGQRLFARFGKPLVFFGRLIPTIRSLISIPAGLLRMRLVPFLLWSTLGTALWSSGLTIAGWVLGTKFENVDAILGPVSTGVIVAIISLYLWRQFTWKSKNSPQAKPTNNPSSQEPSP